MRRIAEVISRENDAVWVKLDNPSKECGNCRGCIRLDGSERPDELVLQVSDPTSTYQPGDRVFLETETRDMVKALTVLYGIPFASLFAGYGLTHLVVGVDAVAGLGAVAAMLVGAAVSRPLARKIADRAGELHISARAC